MRALLTAVLALGLAGCMDLDLPDFSDGRAAFPGTPASPTNPRCRAVALDRSSDVAMQGFEEDVQREVYERTYADCVAWAARGAQVNSQ